MDNLNTKNVGEAIERMLSNANKKKKIIFGIVGFAVVIAVVATVILTVQRAGNYDKVEQENKELKASLAVAESELADANKELEAAQNQLANNQEKLDYAEGQVELLEESTAALKKQVTSLDSTIDELNNQLEDLLNIEETVPIITKSQLAEQLVAVRELVTAQYLYTNANRKEVSKTWLWGWTLPFSDTSLLATYDGTIKAGIDLNDIKIDVNETDRIITVTLPQCKITDNNIPQETINVLEVKNNLFNEVTFDDYNQFISEEKKLMEEKAVERGLLTNAYNEAVTTITAFLRLMPGMDTYKLIVK